MGPFRLRIPFIHIKLLPSEFIQGLIISGATLAGAPIVQALGLDFMQAVAVFIASFLITSVKIIFGEPMAGWVTPTLPLVMIFLAQRLGFR